MHAGPIYHSCFFEGPLYHSSTDFKSFQWQFGTFTVQKTSAQGRSRKNLVLREDLEKIDQILTFFYVRCLGQV